MKGWMEDVWVDVWMNRWMVEWRTDRWMDVARMNVDQIADYGRSKDDDGWVDD